MILSYQESRELGEFADVESPKIVEDIMERYNLSTMESIRLALRQAAYAGFCAGKGYHK